MTVRQVIALLLLGLPALAAAGNDIDMGQCAATANKYGANPFSLDMRELDTLRSCVNWQVSAMVSEAQQQRLQHALQRNFASMQGAELSH